MKFYFQSQSKTKKFVKEAGMSEVDQFLNWLMMKKADILEGHEDWIADIKKQFITTSDNWEQDYYWPINDAFNACYQKVDDGEITSASEVLDFVISFAPHLPMSYDSDSFIYFVNNGFDQLTLQYEGTVLGRPLTSKPKSDDLNSVISRMQEDFSNSFPESYFAFLRKYSSQYEYLGGDDASAEFFGFD